MEELIKMLVDAGAIAIDGARWTLVTEKLHAARVPPTLTGVLQARLDSLRPREKQALQQAAVVGFVFWDQALAAIDSSAPDALPGVARRELVVRRAEARLDGVREYAFHHHLLHQVTYRTVLKHLRRGYHARAATWLAGLTGARPTTSSAWRRSTSSGPASGDAPPSSWLAPPSTPPAATPTRRWPTTWRARSR
jgi:predicted ATPase